MESLIVLFITVVVVILKAKAASNTKGSSQKKGTIPSSMNRTFQNYQNQQRAASMNQARPNQQRASSINQVRPNQQRASSMNQARPNQQKVASAYATQQKADGRQQNQVHFEKIISETTQRPDSILARANQNLAEYEGEETSNTLTQLNDVMLMGYTGKLTFERDFIAEGIEMLNRYELPDQIDQFESQWQS